MMIYGHNREIAAWVAQKIGIDDFGECVAIGLAKEGKIICGVVYNNYRDGNIEMSIATTDPRWATRRTLNAFYAYPFIQLGCRRVTVIIRNQSIVTFLKRLGHVYEGTVRQCFSNGDDGHIYGMLKSECRYLRNHNGQEIEFTTRAA